MLLWSHLRVSIPYQKTWLTEDEAMERRLSAHRHACGKRHYEKRRGFLSPSMGNAINGFSKQRSHDNKLTTLPQTISMAMNHRVLAQYHCQSRPHTCPWHRHQELLITSDISETFSSGFVVLLCCYYFSHLSSTIKYVYHFKRTPLVSRYCYSIKGFWLNQK